MGATYMPSKREDAVLGICSVFLLPFLPIIWILLIFYGLARIIAKPYDARETVGEIARAIIVATFFPFSMFWMNIVTFSLWILASVYGLVRVQPPAWVVNSGKFPLASSSTYNPDRQDPIIPTHEKRYRYSLLQEVDNFRTLIIFPGSNKDPLRGQLVTHRLSDSRRPIYDALSYTWADENGDASLSREFHCQGNRGIIPIPITKNCEAAIRNLRLPKKIRRVWIDAICIDQTNFTERTHQVSLMSKIYTLAQSVVVYTGEGTAQTDRMFDWLNSLKASDVDIRLRWELDNLAGDVLISLSRYWDIGRERLLAFTREPGAENTVSESDLVGLAQEYFSRRWFKRVWVLQEVALPDMRRVSVMCGTKATSAIRALHALCLLNNDSFGSMTRIFILLRRRIKNPKIPHLLDVLIETRDREAQDPRDRIFGVLSISHALDRKLFQDLQANYAMTTQEVYAHYSALFIQYHGPGFFLALIKSPPTITGLPSWSADWTSPWPNRKALFKRDFVACSRPANEMDSGATFNIENGHHILTLVRSRILDGYFTKDGHLDDATSTSIVGLKNLGKDEVLIEMYPGLAALLKKETENEYYIFLQICPHALSENGVKDMVDRWDSVVTNARDPNNQISLGGSSCTYLNELETFGIR